MDWDKIFQIAIPKDRYSEAERLSATYFFLDSLKVRDRIDRITGVLRDPTKFRKKPVGWKRQKLPRSHYHKLSVNILRQITGDPTPFLINGTGKLDHRLRWLLENILITRKQSHHYRFYVAIAQDAGVWPIPKWWVVTRRLLGPRKTFSKSAS